MALNSSLPPHQVVQKLALQQTAQLRLGIQALLWSFLLTPLLFLASPAEAQTSWKGTISSDWNTAGNWTAGVPTSRRDVIIGDSNFTGPNQPSMNSKSTCKSLVVGTGSIACVLSVSQTLTVLGDVTIGANGRINHNTRKGISVTGNWTNLGIYSAGQVHASVAFSGANQIITGTTTFNRLNINAGSKVILNANITVNNQLNISGTLDPGESPTFTVSGNTRFALNSGGTLLVKAATFAGNYAVTGSKSFSANATIEYGATVLNQTVANNLTYGTLRISGALTKTLGGNLPALSASSATSGNIFVIGGTFDLSTFSADRAGGTVGGTLSIANGATLRIGGTHTFPANYKIHTLGASSTVEYSGTAQLVSTESYGNLTLSSGTGAAVKTMTTNAMTIAGNLSSVLGAGTAVSFTAAAPLTVRGNVLLGPATTFNAGSFAHSFGASWTNNGTFAGGTGSAAFTGSSAALSGSGTNNFNNLTLTGAGITAASGTSLNVAGYFSTSGAGTFQHSPAGPGAATLTGVARTISGNSIVFNHL